MRGKSGVLCKVLHPDLGVSGEEAHLLFQVALLGDSQVWEEGCNSKGFFGYLFIFLLRGSQKLAKG